MQAQFADGEHVAIIEPKPGEWRRTLLMHDDGNVEHRAQDLRRRKMIGMRMRVDDVMDANALLARQGQIVIDLPVFRIDQRSNPRLRTSDEI